jgi:hypothetical protein
MARIWVTGYIKDDGTKVSGYWREVKNIAYSKSRLKEPPKSIQEIDSRKEVFLAKAEKLTAIKKKMYSNMPIESAMSTQEKRLTKRTSGAWNMLNRLNILKRKMKGK